MGIRSPKTAVLPHPIPFGLVVFGSEASGLVSSELVGCCLAILVECFGFGCDWSCGFAAAGCVASGFAMSGSAAAGFVALGLAAAGLAFVRLMQLQVHHSDAFDT